MHLLQEAPVVEQPVTVLILPIPATASISVTGSKVAWQLPCKIWPDWSVIVQIGHWHVPLTHDEPGTQLQLGMEPPQLFDAGQVPPIGMPPAGHVVGVHSHFLVVVLQVKDGGQADRKSVV